MAQSTFKMISPHEKKRKNLSFNHVEKMSLIYRKSHPKIQPMIVLLDSGDNESSGSTFCGLIHY